MNAKVAYASAVLIDALFGCQIKNDEIFFRVTHWNRDSDSILAGIETDLLRCYAIISEKTESLGYVTNGFEFTKTAGILHANTGMFIIS